MTKDQIVESVTQDLKQAGLRLVGQDLTRPWGGYLLINESQIDEFIDKYFPGERGRINDNGAKLSPKILMVAPHTRLSWQYHDRRQELWKVVQGPVAVYSSSTDAQPAQPTITPVGTTIHIGRTTRHRLEGIDNWAIVAEIWSHTDPAKPSDEADIHRLADDFGRQTPKQ
jgi:mannose-6-phosphate isomerase